MMRPLAVAIATAALLPRGAGFRKDERQQVAAHAARRGAWEHSACQELGLLGSATPETHRSGHCEGVEQQLLDEDWWDPSYPKFVRGNQAKIDRLIAELAAWVLCVSDDSCEPMKDKCKTIIAVAQKLKGKSFLGKFKPTFDAVISLSERWLEAHDAGAVEKRPQGKEEGGHETSTEKIFEAVVREVEELDAAPGAYSEREFQEVVPYYTGQWMRLNAGFREGNPEPRVGTHTTVQLMPLFLSLVTAVHPLPAYEGNCYLSAPHLPGSDGETKEAGGEPFRAREFLPCFKTPKIPREGSMMMAFTTRAGGWFRDISAISKDHKTPQVLGMMGARLRYVSGPSAGDDFHRFEEVAA